MSTKPGQLHTTYACGSEWIHNQTIAYPGGPNIYFMREGTMDDNSGDSGAPVYASTTAVGIVSGYMHCTGTCNGRGSYRDTLYRQIYDEDTALGATVSTN